MAGKAEPPQQSCTKSQRLEQIKWVQMSAPAVPAELEQSGQAGLTIRAL
jgi:hypothetical protein